MFRTNFQKSAFGRKKKKKDPVAALIRRVWFSVIQLMTTSHREVCSFFFILVGYSLHAY
jgi:hypothetical protein